MPFRFQNPVDLIVTVLAFALVLALWLCGAFFWLGQRLSHKKKMDARLGLGAEQTGKPHELRLWKDGREATTTVPGGNTRLSLSQRLDRLRRDAGWEAPTHAVLFGVIGGVTLLFALTLSLTGSPIAAMGAIAAGLAVFWTYLKQCIVRCSARFERQLADALDLAARSLRAGHPLVGAFRVVAEEIPAPVGVLFQEVCQQQALGVPLEVALRQASDNSGSGDMKLFATSVIIQIRSGGDLADMMDRVVAVIRDRIRLAGRVRVLTAQTQFSKRVLIALPIIMFFVLNLISPEYLKPLYETTGGKVMLIVAAGLLTLGAWVMNRMAVLKY